MAVPRGGEQRRRPVRGPCVRVCASVEQEPEGVDTPEPCGDVQRCSLVVVAIINAYMGVEQNLSHFDTVVLPYPMNLAYCHPRPWHLPRRQRRAAIWLHWR